MTALPANSSSTGVTLIGPTAARYKGGIAQFTSRLAEELSSGRRLQFISWHQLYPYFLAKRDFEDKVSAARISDVPAAMLLGYMNPLSWRRAAAEIAQFGSQRIVFTWAHPVHAPVYLALIFWLRRWSASSELILLCHNVKPHEQFFGAAALTRAVAARMDRLAVHGSSERDAATNLVPGKPVSTLYLPLFDRLAMSDSDEGDVSERENTILFFGIIRPYKGLDLLLRALAVLRPKLPRIRLLIAGELFGFPPGEPDPLELVEELGLADAVETDIRYIPNEDVGKIFSRAALAVFPYRSATQSGAIATAYANGVPVVATRVGSIPDVVEEGVSGYLAEPEDVPSLAAAIERCFSTPPPRSSVRKFARRFSWKRYAAALCGEEEAE